MDLIKLARGVALATSFLVSTFSHADTLLFDFGQSTTQTTPNYNNITDPQVHTQTGLINSDGVTTTVSLAITAPFHSTINTNGTTSPDAALGFPVSATRDNFFGNTVAFQGQTVPTVQLRMGGLDPAKLYDFTFFASRMGVTDNRQTEYRVTGASTQTVYLNPTENSSQAAIAIGIQPTTDGTVTLDLRPGPDNVNSNGFFYLGAMRISSQAALSCEGDDPSVDDKVAEYPLQAGGANMGYMLYRPVGYSQAPCRGYPLLVWLHGLGDLCSKVSLSALDKASNNSPGYQIKTGSAYSSQRPFLQGLIVEPQTCSSSWSPSAIDSFITYLTDPANPQRLRVDPDRIYMTGLSLGGGGTWAYAATYPKKVAAIVPIAGTNQSSTSMEKASHVPVWAFHNFNDTNSGTKLAYTLNHLDRMTPFAQRTVIEGYSSDGTMASTDRTASLLKINSADALPTNWQWINGRALTDDSNSINLTIYPASGHSGWATAYGTQQMWAWLYAQRLQTASAIAIGSQSITPATVSKTSGSEILITSKITLNGAQLASFSADLKGVGGSNSAGIGYNSTTKLYELRYVLPTSGLTSGTKAIGLTAVDQSGRRVVKYVTLTVTD